MQARGALRVKEVKKQPEIRDEEIRLLFPILSVAAVPESQVFSLRQRPST
jgi:hypothetical protein